MKVSRVLRGDNVSMMLLRKGDWAEIDEEVKVEWDQLERHSGDRKQGMRRKQSMKREMGKRS